MKQLIAQISSKQFDPSQYEDEVRKRIEDDIARFTEVVKAANLKFEE